MNFVGYCHGFEEELPFRKGDTVTLPKDTDVETLHPKGNRCLSRKQKVKIDHFTCGIEVPDYDYERYYESTYPYAEEKEVDGKTYYVISNPQIVWAGTGRYWFKADVNDVEELNPVSKDIKPKVPVTPDGEYLVFCETWTESERGWGCRPDGFTLHLTKEDRDSFVDAYCKKWNNKDYVPDEYTRADGNVYLVAVDQDAYLEVERSKNGVWGDGPKVGLPKYEG